jgi:hypothetical protein
MARNRKGHIYSPITGQTSSTLITRKLTRWRSSNAPQSHWNVLWPNRGLGTGRPFFLSFFIFSNLQST